MTCRLGPVLRDVVDCAAAAERDDWINADARGPEVLCDIKLVTDDTEGTLLFRLGDSPAAVEVRGGIGGGRATIVGTEICRCRNGLFVECERSSTLGGTLVSSESESELESEASNATDLDRGFFSGLARPKSP